MEGKSLRDLEAAISNISRSLQDYYTGNPYAHLTVAVELRKLLCENRRGQDESLVLRDNPAFALHPLAPSSLPIDGPNVYVIRGPMRFGGHTSGYMDSFFDETQELMSLAEWREQQLVSQKITIRELIKSVADKEGAHSDKDANDTLVLLQSIRLGGNAGIEAELIAVIGHYVLRNLLVRRLLLIRSEILGHFKAQRGALGPGALRLSVKGSPRPYSDGLALDYLTSAVVREMNCGDTSLHLRAADIMEAHSNTASFLLWIDDLQEHIWFLNIGEAG